MLVSPAKRGLQSEFCYDSFCSVMAKNYLEKTRWLGLLVGSWVFPGKKKGGCMFNSYWQRKYANNKY